jgi:hypothetical protein
MHPFEKHINQIGVKLSYLTYFHEDKRHEDSIRGY